ncbi:MAG: tRNA (adenosine(37)-N6)-threonylcarbamoyltransferase complex ATPase subunit type 1 TsaE, partial [Microbacteriaceae bacterium]
PLIHLDAYRLGSAFELDDLGLDYQTSITVAEWGKGMLEHEYDSWLELVLERIPSRNLAAGAAEQSAIQGTQDSFSQSQDYATVIEEPRNFQLLGFGERWQGVTLEHSGD